MRGVHKQYIENKYKNKIYVPKIVEYRVQRTVIFIVVIVLVVVINLF
mgnify:CR=1 FL=1